MKNIFFSFMLMILFVTGCGYENSSKTEKIIVGMDESPLGYRNAQGEVVGFEVDLARETAKRMGADIEFRIIDWDKKDDELNSGRIDVIWNGLDITPERQEKMLFSKPYMSNRRIIVVNKDNPKNIQREHDLEGKIIGAKARTTSAHYVEKTDSLRNGLAEFKIYTTDADAFKALESGEIDALICDEIVARYEMSKHKNKFAVVEVTVGPVHDTGIGFRKGDTELRDRVQAAFDEIVAEGTARKISEKWFGADIIQRRR